MSRTTCAKCNTFYTVTPMSNNAFCSDCVQALQSEASAAEQYQRRIDAGDVNVEPHSPEDARRVRRAIKRRLTSQPDCKHTRR